LLVPYNLIAETNFSYAKNLYIKSFPSNQAKNELSEKNDKNITIKIKELSEGEMREIAFSLIEKMPSKNQSSTLLDTGLLKKMEIFSGDETSSAHLFSKVARTRTIAGEAALARMLAEPIQDISLLKERQNIIQELINNQDLFEKLDAELQAIKEVESFLYSYFQQEDPTNKELFKKSYFRDSLDFLNQSSMALELGTRLRNFLSFAAATWLPLLIVKLPGDAHYFGAQQSGAPISRSDAFFRGIQSLKNLPHEFPKFLDAAADHMVQQQQNPSVSVSHAEFKKAIIMTLSVYGAIFSGIYGYYMIQAYNNEKLQNNIANHLQTKLIGIEAVLEHSNFLHQLIQHNDKTQNLLREVNFSSHSEGKFKQLLETLHHNTFRGEASFFSLTGRVLAAHSIMNEVKEEFAPFVELIGTIDAYLSIAKLCKEHQKNPVHYTFVEFVEQDTPYVYANNFWNPFIDPNVVVANSIELGTAEKPHNIILTGPNTGGKSTVIKGLLINVLLAQTFGIAPADNLRMTPFAIINCYLNITDDISAGTSLFKAEVLRAKKLIEGIRSLQAGQFCFTIMDEVFSGTSPKEGEEAAYKFAEQLGNYTNSICSIATHFPSLTKLEEQSAFKNYQVTVTKNTDGSWRRPFKLQEGASSLNIALDLLQEEGIFTA
ncbi:MAG: hypothetical protein AB7R69_04700, partial [Candidatus Babeliales bacterium]